MQNSKANFLTKFSIILAVFIQSFNCQANTFDLQRADSLFNTNNYQEAMVYYENMLENDQVFSPAMLLKMAFISEGKGDFSKASFYLAKYYDINPNPRVITKIKTLTEQPNLVGYEISDGDRFFKFLSDLQQEITGIFAALLLISIITLLFFKEKANKPKYYIPTLMLIFFAFIANNFLKEPSTGIVTGSPTIIMNKPTAGGKLIKNVDPGHRVIIKSSKDIWYEIEWGNQKAFVKKESITKL
ncbi:hypothetical protein MM236_16530 [Belliella sp. DSM 107340]|uniref:SH3 domain-containing protein n=1 Tax=Belliella calami TaxID=2923436 RepID=A0ABS9USK0_9BACT|nr:hypothetical protein [Belliella calami]MCH7399607.1 hypothetical protein [Belliella calami]